MSYAGRQNMGLLADIAFAGRDSLEHLGLALYRLPCQLVRHCQWACTHKRIRVSKVLALPHAFLLHCKRYLTVHPWHWQLRWVANCSLIQVLAAIAVCYNPGSNIFLDYFWKWILLRSKVMFSCSHVLEHQEALSSDSLLLDLLT